MKPSNERYHQYYQRPNYSINITIDITGEHSSWGKLWRCVRVRTILYFDYNFNT